MNFVRPEIDPDLEDIIPDFLENTLKDYNSFKLHYENKSVDGMRKICHTILGTAESYGFLQLNEIVLNLQTNLQTEDFNSLDENFVIFSDYINFIKNEFS